MRQGNGCLTQRRRLSQQETSVFKNIHLQAVRGRRRSVPRLVRQFAGVREQASATADESAFSGRVLRLHLARCVMRCRRLSKLCERSLRDMCACVDRPAHCVHASRVTMDSLAHASGFGWSDSRTHMWNVGDASHFLSLPLILKKTERKINN